MYYYRHKSCSDLSYNLCGYNNHEINNYCLYNIVNNNIRVPSAA